MRSWLRALSGKTGGDASDRTSFWILAAIAIVVPFGWLLLILWSPLRRGLRKRQDRESS